MLSLGFSVISYILILIAECSGDNATIAHGEYPYMTYLYYPNERIMDSNGVRFFRGGTLVTPQHVLTASIDPVGGDGFPRSTLLVRAGALVVATTADLQSGEQEREVIQILRPQNHSAEASWSSDITVVKVLEPFASSASVAPTQITTTPRHYTDKLCGHLSYVPKNAQDQDRILQRVVVQVLVNSKCPAPYQADRMLCSMEQNLGKVPTILPCRMNAGGPLLCGKDVVALHSYSSNPKCKLPHKYQRFHFWENFLNCSVQNECSSKSCEAVCFATDKDEPAFSPTPVVDGETKEADKDDKSGDVTTAVNEKTTENEREDDDKESDKIDETIERKAGEDNDETINESNAKPEDVSDETNKTNTGSVDGEEVENPETEEPVSRRVKVLPMKIPDTSKYLLRSQTSSGTNVHICVSLFLWNLFFKLFY